MAAKKPTPKLTDEQAQQFIDNSKPKNDSIAVTLTPEQWKQVVGILEQGSAVVLAQMAMQQGGLPQVAQLSSMANAVIDAIKQQLET